jgi:hypothetical protein
MAYHLESIGCSNHHRARDEEFRELCILVILSRQEEKLVLRISWWSVRKDEKELTYSDNNDVPQALLLDDPSLLDDFLLLDVVDILAVSMKFQLHVRAVKLTFQDTYICKPPRMMAVWPLMIFFKSTGKSINFEKS